MTESQYYREMRKGGLGGQSKKITEMEARIKRLEKAVDYAHRVMLYRGWHTIARPSLEADAWDEIDSAFRGT